MVNAHAATSSDNSIDRVPTHRHMGHAVWALLTAQEACWKQSARIIGLARPRLGHVLIEQCHGVSYRRSQLSPWIRDGNFLIGHDQLHWFNVDDQSFIGRCDECATCFRGSKSDLDCLAASKLPDLEQLASPFAASKLPDLKQLASP